MRLTLLRTAAVLLVLTGTAQAHHSFAMFDRGEGKQKTISGVVKEVSIVNPHGWFKILVPAADGRAIGWSFEMASAVNLQRMGWSKDLVQPGDKVTVTYYPLRIGSGGGALVSVQLANGRSVKGMMEGDRGYPTRATQ